MKTVMGVTSAVTTTTATATAITDCILYNILTFNRLVTEREETKINGA